MGRLIAAFLIAASASAQQQSPAQEQSKEFQQAGHCERCHVSSVLEWGLSTHAKTGINCIACHGVSQGHYLDERNNVKPDRIPRGVAIASLCVTCHKDGCPKSSERASCQNCHQAHALINPTRGSVVQDKQSQELAIKGEAFERHMADGDRLVKERSWPAARDAYRRALEQIPGDRRATTQLRMCERRINPRLAGFEIVGSQFDLESALPKEVKVSGTDIEMVLMPAGDFDMGSDRFKDATPVHTVRVEAFYLAKFEVTQAQWKVLMGTNPSRHTALPNAERMPVEQVSWDDCQSYIRKLNERVPGGSFRLPTEAEWEYAARAGSSVPLQHDELLRLAWFRENTASASEAGKEFLTIEAYSPRPVGSKQPNPWGAYDMLGNVWEWCSSASRPYPFDEGDGRESASAPELRILRGGGFADSADFLDPALRHAERRDRRYRWNGLRLARSVPEPVQPATTGDKQ